MPPDLVIAVLAAGASRRLGRPKQLVPIDGEPLLRRQCRCALAAAVGEVVVVLGCNADEHRGLIGDLPVAVHVNDRWAEGLASSLRCAVGAARSRGAALLVLPCDQYRIVPADLRALCAAWRRAPGRACASRHGEHVGPPAIVPAAYYDRLGRLRGDVGARAILYGAEFEPPAELLNPRAQFDVDCPEDLTRATEWSRRRTA